MKSMCLYLLLFLSSFGATLTAEENQKPAQATEKAANVTTSPSPSPYFSEGETEQDKNGAQEPHFSELLVRMLLILTFTIVALILISWFAKRFLYSRMQDLNRSSRIQILEKRTLSPKSILYVVKIDEEEVALAESPSGVVLLKVLSK